MALTAKKEIIEKFGSNSFIDRQNQSLDRTLESTS